MTEGTTTPDAASAASSDKSKIRKVTTIVLAACAFIFVWYVISDRLTPATDQARVRAVTIPVAPRVSGELTDVNVRLHSVVGAGDVMFVIDQRPYELAVRTAEANLDNAAQQVGARTATVKSATARVGSARAQLDRAQRNFDRTQAILAKNPGALSQADLDRTETSLAQAIERVASAEADREKAIEQLGEIGENNPELRAATVALEQAQLNLTFTTIEAPIAGAIESFNVSVGHNAQAGQPLATLVSADATWIEADMRENNLSRMKIGDHAEFVLDVAPGRVFKGTVRSIGFGVSSGETTNRGQLPSITSAQGWLRDPQRFPVVIAFDDDDTLGLLRAGGQADVVVFTGGNFLFNGVSKIQLRLRSLLSYVR